MNQRIRESVGKVVACLSSLFSFSGPGEIANAFHGINLFGFFVCKSLKEEASALQERTTSRILKQFFPKETHPICHHGYQMESCLSRCTGGNLGLHLRIALSGLSGSIELVWSIRFVCYVIVIKGIASCKREVKSES